MAFRRLLRGRVEWDRLDAVGRELARRSGADGVRIEFLDADNWLSVPMVVDDRWFVKAISAQHSRVHALLTTGRNLGAFAAGTDWFFEHFGDPVEMATHELEATRQLRDLGVNAPEPVEAFECEGLGVLVLEYLPEFRPLSELDPDTARSVAPTLFGTLATMHEAGLAHGDLRGENVLLSGGELYFIDATKVREAGHDQARAYDLACALAALTPLLGARDAVAIAAETYDSETLLAAREFLDVVNMRPDHGFDAASVRGEIEKTAA